MQPGDTFEGGYRLIRELGRGGHATVFLGEHVEIGQRVAIKVMQGESERFTREGRVLAQLSSPHTVRLLAFGRTKNNEQYLISEWVDGESLTAYLNNHAPISWEQAVDIVRQVLSSLEEAHRRDIVHRDIKPGNVMIANGTEVKVLDFGVAKLMQDPTITGTHEVLGTPRYMAPETLRGKPVNAACDVFAVGMLSYAMLTGRHANSEDGVQKIIGRHMDDTPFRLPAQVDIPMPFRSWLDQMMSKDPAARPADAGAALAAMPSIRAASPSNPSGHNVDVFAPTATSAAVGASLRVATPPTGEDDTVSSNVVVPAPRVRPVEAMPAIRVPEPSPPQESAPPPPRKAVPGRWEVEAPLDGAQRNDTGKLYERTGEQESSTFITIAAVMLLVLGVFAGGYWYVTRPKAPPPPPAVNPLVPDEPRDPRAEASSPDAGFSATEHTQLAVRGIAHFENGEFVEALRIFHQIEQGADLGDKRRLEGGRYRERALEKILERARAAAAEAKTIEEIDAAGHEVLIAQTMYRANPEINQVVKELRQAARDAEEAAKEANKKKKKKQH